MSLRIKFRNKLAKEGLTAAIFATLRWTCRRVGLPFFVEPYDFIQSHVEDNLHRYLDLPRERLGLVVTVGAHLGDEVKRMLRRYPMLRFHLYEASPRYSVRLKQRFSSEARVTVHECAVSDVEGSLTFHETNLSGSGSLLQANDLARQCYGMQNSESFVVKAVRLDQHATEQGYSKQAIDCLWIDVQGAERAVLLGASRILNQVKSVFVEVAMLDTLYNQGTRFNDIAELLQTSGFILLGLGVDPTNGTGNAIFVRRQGDSASPIGIREGSSNA
jgi:FkbM family methyltransferase